MAKTKSAQPKSSQTKSDEIPEKKDPGTLKIGPFESSPQILFTLALGVIIGVGIGQIMADPSFSLAAVMELVGISQPTPPPAVQAAPTDVSPIVTPTPLPSGVVFSFEQAPLFAFGYSGIFDPKVNVGMGLLSVRRKGSAGTSYRLEYRLPEAGGDNGYAGMALQFVDPPDWSDYQAIEIKITFGDKSARCDIGIMDEANKVDYVRLGDRLLYGDGVTAIVSEEGDTITIPFDTYFNKINRKLVKMVLFNIDSSFSSGNHEFTVQSLRLLKTVDDAR